MFLFSVFRFAFSAIEISSIETPREGDTLVRYVEARLARAAYGILVEMFGNWSLVRSRVVWIGGC